MFKASPDSVSFLKNALNGIPRWSKRSEPQRGNTGRPDQISYPLHPIFSGAAGNCTLFPILADVEHFEDKLDRWWQGGPAQKLVLQTANRNEILFSVTHSHHPFSQGFEGYNRELQQWVRNIRDAGLQAFNFGYLFLHRISDGREGYSSRVIHNPPRRSRRRKRARTRIGSCS